MEQEIVFTEAQIALIKSALGVESLQGVKVKFEVQSTYSSKMIATEAYSSSSIIMKMCYCGGGRFSPACC